MPRRCGNQFRAMRDRAPVPMTSRRGRQRKDFAMDLVFADPEAGGMSA